MPGRISERIAVFVTRRSGAILVVALLLLLASSFAASRLRLNPEMTAFLPARNPAVADFRRVVESLGALDHHIVMITVAKGADGEATEAMVDEVAAEFERLPSVSDVEYRLPDPQTIVKAVLPQFVLLLTPAELDAAAKQLSDANIRETMAENRMLLQTPQSAVGEQLVRLDPLKLRSILIPRLQQATGGLRLDPTSRHLRSADGTTYLVVVHPKTPAQDIGFANELMKQSQEIERRISSKLGNAAKPRYEYAGGYAITHADAQLIRADMIANVLVSVFGVLVLFIIAFRSIRALAYAAIPMIAAIVVAFGVASVAFGELGAASAGFAALLAGLGIDFTTVLYQRFIEERSGGANVTQALLATWRSTLPGVIAAALTTAATFYGFLFTEFRGMSQMGFITGTGILLFLASVALVLPALLVKLERDDRPAPRTFLHVFGIRPLMEWSLRRPTLTVFLWIGFTLAMAIAARQVVFSDDAGRLRARGNAGIMAQERLAKMFGRGGDPIMLVAEARTADEALATSERTLPMLQRLRSRGTIGGFESVASILPSRARQEQTLAALRANEAGALDPARITASLHAAAIEQGFRPGLWDEHLELLSAGLSVRESRSMIEGDDPLIEPLRRRFLQRSGDSWLSIVYIHPPSGRWIDGAPTELRALADTDSRLILTGITVVSAELRRITRLDAVRATSIGIAIVLVILLIWFRSITRSVLIFVPFVAGMIGMLGSMALFGLELNLMNIFIGLMLVGVAPDYAIYIVQRFDENRENFARLAPETGKAVAMAAATTIVGYGSFALSHYPGLQSIGYAATFGIGLSGLASVTLLPALLTMRRTPPAP